MHSMGVCTEFVLGPQAGLLELTRTDTIFERFKGSCKLTLRRIIPLVSASRVGLPMKKVCQQ